MTSDSAEQAGPGRDDRAPARVLVVGIGTPLAEGLVERLQAVPGIRLVHPAEHLPPQRYVADHAGEPDADRLAALIEALRGCEVVLGVPADTPAGLAALVAEGAATRWVQAMAAGAGEQVRRAQLDTATLQRVTVTTSAGVHAQPLAEFAMFGLLAFHKDVDRLLELRRTGAWPTRWTMTQLQGRRLLVLGMGSIGTAVATRAAAFGMTVTGVRRRIGGEPPPGVSALRPLSELHEALADADDVVLTLPGTTETEGVLDAAAMAALPAGAVVVNVGRGSCVDEDALVGALESGHLCGAVLDVAATEPRPPEHPLWQRPDVLQSPHTAALSVHEDSRIVDLFLENVSAYRSGLPLRNVVRTDVFY